MRQSYAKKNMWNCCFRRLGIVCLVVLAAFCTAPGDAKKKKQKQQQLEIITENLPDDCSSYAAKGDTVTVHYTGRLQATGQIFDSSRMNNREPFTVTLGAGSVIKGWDEGLIGMCAGEVRRLIIPPHLAYGDEGVSGVIPGGATLEFEVELMDLAKKPLINIPQLSGLTWPFLVIIVIVLAVYELYKRANKQGVELRDSKRREKENKRAGGKGNRKKQ